MSVLSLNSSHVGSLPALNQQQHKARHPSDQRSQTSAKSTGSVWHYVNDINRKASAGSVVSQSSRKLGPLRVINGNATPNRITSHSSIQPPDSSAKNVKPKLKLIIPLQQEPLRIETVSTSQLGHDSSLLANDGTLQGIQSKASNNAPSFISRGDTSSSCSVIAELRGTGASNKKEDLEPHPDSGARPAITGSEPGPNTFKRLMSNLRASGSKDRKSLNSKSERWSLEDLDDNIISEIERPKSGWLGAHRKASSWSSAVLAAPVKHTPAGADGSTSPAQHSGRASKLRFIRRGSRTSRGSNRNSADIGIEIARVLDEAASKRAVQRRKVLDELVVSEEGYINDLKILTHVYLTILASTPSFPRLVQIEVEGNLGEILQLHEEILYLMKLVQSNSDFQQPKAMARNSRGSSSGSDNPLKISKSDSRIAQRTTDSTGERRPISRLLTSEPQEAACIAKIFENMLPRFLIYEEYGARYESVLQIVATISKAIPSWAAFERGIEALMNSLLPKRVADEGNKKGLTLEDLVIKPIQRVCRYPLLLAELLKNTHKDDNEDAEIEIRKVMNKLRETASEINKATSDPLAQMKLQRSWNLQDLLTFSEVSSSSNFRMLGHAKLCGTLFVVYQTNDGMRGQYMLCALFLRHLLLAIPETGSKRFKVIAVLNTIDLQIEQADEGRGLQCHNALYCWKVIFGFGQQLYESILCACSAREENQWRAELIRSSKSTNPIPATSDCTFFGLSAKSLGLIHGPPGSLARRMAMRRTATIASRTSSSQVIIRNTHSTREVPSSPKAPSASFNRSQSLLSTNRVAVLAPNRADRIRLENAMEGVWTKETLPFPGMAMHRGGNLIRASKDSVMRKISKASTNTQASNHSVGCAGLADPFVEDASPGLEHLFDLCCQTGTPSDSLCSKLERYETPEAQVEKQDPGDVPRKVSFNLSKHRDDSEATVIAGDDDGKEIASGTRNEKQKKLLKAFSTDGIRNWFT